MGNAIIRVTKSHFKTQNFSKETGSLKEQNYTWLLSAAGLQRQEESEQAGQDRKTVTGNCSSFYLQQQKLKFFIKNRVLGVPDSVLNIHWRRKSGKDSQT